MTVPFPGYATGRGSGQNAVALEHHFKALTEGERGNTLRITCNIWAKDGNKDCRTVHCEA